MSDVFIFEGVEEFSEPGIESAPSTSLEDKTESDNEISNQFDIVQNTEGDNGEFSTTTLDIAQLNEFVASENELRSMQIVNPSTNDYFDFMPETIENYFAGIKL